jgi:hypothetical protein
MNPLKRKVELAFCNYLSARPELAGVEVFPGHRAEKRTLPCVVVYGEVASENDQFPPGSGVFDVKMKVFILTQSDDEDIETHDERVTVVQALLFDAEAIRAALNVPFGGPDNRSVKDLHIYDLIETESDEGRDERHFGEVLNYLVICQGVDGPS